MTVQFLRSGTPATQVSIADRPELTLPNGDWSLGWLFTATDATSTGYQLMARTGNGGEIGGMCFMFEPVGSGTANSGKIYIQVNGTTSNSRCATPGVIEAGKSYIYVAQRVGGLLYGKLCPVKSAAPADAATVLTSAAFAVGIALDGVQGLILGVHNVTNRRLGMAMGRVFLAHKALTDAEISELALGKEITQFAAPLVYLRMNDHADVVDTGTLQNSVTLTGPLAAGPTVEFGYSSVPSPPVIDGAPVINGSAVVGEAVTFSPAPTTGNPAPALAYQWTLNGANIAGATGLTCTPAAGDVGKQLRIKQTATNSEGSATATSDPVLVSSTATGLTETLLQSAANNERIHQRINGTAQVALGGTYTGAQPAKFEYQLHAPTTADVMHPWVNAGATIGGGNWSANPLMPQATDGKKYRLRLRSLDGAGNPIYTTEILPNRFGVGDIIAVIGSSSPATWFGDGSGTGNTPDHNYISSTTGSAWVLFGTDGQAAVMAETIAKKSGVPTALITAALGGSTLADWSSTGSNLWATLLSRLAHAGGKLAGLFGSAGSNDIINASAAQTVAAHLAKLRAVRDNIRAATGQPDLPILWSGINRRYDALPLQANNARQAEREFGEDANVYYVQTMDIEVKDPESVEGGDGIHPTGAGYKTCCRRIEYVWTEGVIFGRKQRGPVITSISFMGTKATITLAHRNTGATDITGVSRAHGSSDTPSNPAPVSSVTGIEVTDDDGQGGRIDIPIVSVERADPTRITLTCDRPLVNPKITYLEGAWVDNAVALFDNAPTALPLMADPIGVAGNGAVFIPVSNTLTINYDIAAAAGGTPLTYTVSNELVLTYSVAAALVPGQYAVSQTMTITYDIAPQAASPVDPNFVPSVSRAVRILPGRQAYDAGPFWAVGGTAGPVGNKDPNSTIDIPFDWSAWLADIGSPPISKMEFLLSPGLVSAGAVPTVVGGEVIGGAVMVSEGVLGTAHTVTCRITTATEPARIEDRSVVLQIRDQ